MCFILIFLLTINLLGQHSDPTTLKAMKYNGKIKIDGKLNEQCWNDAVGIENFTQREQNEGEPATEKTMVKVVYNKNAIYFGIWCFDNEPEKISAQKMSRDFSWRSDDNFEIIISTFNDDRNGYLFVTNPNGAKADVLIGDEGREFNKDWNGIWDVATEKTKDGWFIEMKIPFSTFKFKKNRSQFWGINFERNVRRKKEQLMWQGWSRLYEIETISQSGKLVGIQDIEQETKIEIKPYVLSGYELSDGNGKNNTKIGGEINLDITPTLKLNFSANTDFAQVESDRKQINLTRFSIYYPEKRQFFLEGNNYYKTNVDRTRLFYSRRIGIDDETQVDILGGMRLFGKLNKTNIGFMSIQTNEKDSIPTTNYSVIKVKQDIFRQSSISGIVTQKYSKDYYNRVYGTDFTYSTSEFFKNKNLRIGGSFAISKTKKSKTNDDLNKNNLTYNIFLNYPNDIVEFDMEFTTVQSNFNPELGYKSRDNYQMFATELQFNPRFKNMRFFRNLVFKPIDINYYISDKTKKTESVFYEWRPFGFVTKSGEFFEFNIQHEIDNPTEDFELFENDTIPADEYWNNRFEMILSTFRGRKISTFIIGSVGEFYTGHRQKIGLYPSFNINKHLNISLDWEKNYIKLPEHSFTTDEVGGTITYAFNPKLQTGLFAQWNNETENILVNYRINWIPKIGSYFYFVINQEFNTTDGITLERTTILGKLIWRFTL